MGPPHWNQYFRVHDVDRAKAAIEAGGGKVVHGPHEIPGGDFAMNCIDPQGASFGLVGGRQQG
jgi:predicted enzyme related to lactoylglutathione lyase